jgi:hypothetical protein
MLNNFEELNTMLASMVNANMVEPIECEENEYDNAIALFEGMAEYFPDYH